MKRPRSIKRSRKAGGGGRWDSLPWRPVDTDGQDLSSFDDTMFFGLEEVDGSVFVSGEELSAATREVLPVHEAEGDGDVVVQESKTTKKKKNMKLKDQNSKAEELATTDESPIHDVIVDDIPNDEADHFSARKSKKKKAKKAKKGADAGKPKASGPPPLPFPSRISERDTWGDMSLNAALVDSLIGHMKFQWPTTIQSLATPETLRGETDVVGASETGSGMQYTV